MSETPVTEPIDLLAPTVRPEHIITRDNKQYVLAIGLQDLLHRIAAQIAGDGVARFTVESTTEALPGAENDQTAVVRATVTILDAQGVVIRRASQIGDANAQSVTRLMVHHIIRMAETRAISRCLRTLTNVGMVTLEETNDEKASGRQGGDRDGVGNPTRTAVPDRPVGPDTYKDAKGKVWTRPQLLERYSVLYKLAQGNGDQRARLSDNAPLKAIAAEVAAIRRAHPAPAGGGSGA